MRLNRFIAMNGLASRRKADEIIASGEVMVNGTIVTKLGTIIDPTKDQVKVTGKLLKEPASLVYYVINKPRGYVSTTQDPEGRPTVLDLVPQDIRVYPVGRLDVDSEGLLILTNDGELTYHLTHPKFQVNKTYEVQVTPRVREQDLLALRSGVTLEEGVTAPAEVGRISPREDTRGDWISLTIHEGWHRQIRRMLKVLGYDTVRLIRVQEGLIALDGLPTGKYRKLDRRSFGQNENETPQSHQDGSDNA